jgi:hypothetical protein
MTTPFVFVSNVRPDLEHFYQERLFNARVEQAMFSPSSRGLSPIRLLASPTATVPRLGPSDDQQLFVTQLDAPASTVRTLNEGETI